MFYQFHFFRLHETMPHVLLRMVRSGHFYPAGNWVIPSQGRGMVRKRAEACWRMLTHPQSTSIADVESVFFEDRDRYHHDIPDREILPADEPAVSPSVTLIFARAQQRVANKASGAQAATQEVSAAPRVIVPAQSLYAALESPLV